MMGAAGKMFAHALGRAQQRYEGTDARVVRLIERCIRRGDGQHAQNNQVVADCIQKKNPRRHVWRAKVIESGQWYRVVFDTVVRRVVTFLPGV